MVVKCFGSVRQALRRRSAGGAMALMLVSAMLNGCVSGGDRRSPLLSSTGIDLHQATRRVSPSLVYVEASRTVRRRVRLSSGKTVYTKPSRRTDARVGVVVSPKGHVLFPGKLSADDMENVSVWVGSEKVPSEFVSYDKQLQMSVIKVNKGEGLQPLALDAAPIPHVGDWYGGISTTGEERDFLPMSGLCLVTGFMPTQYPGVAIEKVGSLSTGTPLLDRKGRVVALVGDDASATLLSAELSSDLADYVERAVTGVSEEEDVEKAYLGVCLQPIDKAHAKFLGVPASGLWVKHVLDNSPGAAFGLQKGDLVLAVNGKALRFSGSRAQNDFNWNVNRQRLDPFTVTVWRDGDELLLKGKRAPRDDQTSYESKDLGLSVLEINENAYVHRSLTERNGVLVTGVTAGTPAATSSRFGQSLIKKDDVIIELAGMPTPDVASFSKAVEQIRAQQPHAVLVKYKRGRLFGFAGLNLNIGSTNDGGTQE